MAKIFNLCKVDTKLPTSKQVHSIIVDTVLSKQEYSDDIENISFRLIDH